MYDIGILGGMGPQATAKLFDFIVNHTVAGRDQEHINIIVLNDAEIPDRTKFIVGESRENPLVAIRKDISIINQIGVKYVIMPCNTAHSFFREISEMCSCPIFNMVELTMRYIHGSNLPKHVCVLCTKGTEMAKVYEAYGLNEIMYPNKAETQRIGEIIYGVKNTNSADLKQLSMDLLYIMNEIANGVGPTTFVLACTELSVLDKTMFGGFNVVDAMDILAFASIKAVRHDIRWLKSDIRYDENILKGLIG